MIVDPGVRGKGVGKLLVEGIVADLAPYRIRRTLLATEDAHELYSKYGWEPLPVADHWLIRRG